MHVCVYAQTAAETRHIEAVSAEANKPPEQTPTPEPNKDDKSAKGKKDKGKVSNGGRDCSILVPSPNARSCRRALWHPRRAKRLHPRETLEPRPAKLRSRSKSLSLHQVSSC